MSTARAQLVCSADSISTVKACDLCQIRVFGKVFSYNLKWFGAFGWSRFGLHGIMLAILIGALRIIMLTVRNNVSCF
jgi:hypothetical protein